MIKGVHAMFYSSQPEEFRAFLRDKLQLPYTDVGEGWLIFDLPEGDVGCHPTEGDPVSGTHDVSFYCDDLEATVAAMKARGVVFDQEIADHGYGYVTHLTMPGGVRVQIYQPKYVKRTSSPRAAAGPGARQSGAQPAGKSATSRGRAKAKPRRRTAARSASSRGASKSSSKRGPKRGRAATSRRRRSGRRR